MRRNAPGASFEPFPIPHPRFLLKPSWRPCAPAQDPHLSRPATRPICTKDALNNEVKVAFGQGDFRWKPQRYPCCARRMEPIADKRTVLDREQALLRLHFIRQLSTRTSTEADHKTPQARLPPIQLKSTAYAVIKDKDRRLARSPAVRLLASDQHDSEASFVSHHPSVSFGSICQRKGFDHEAVLLQGQESVSPVIVSAVERWISQLAGQDRAVLPYRHESESCRGG